MFYKTQPDFNQLKVFGSLCYASTLSINRSKFDPRSLKCVFISFKRGIKLFCWIFNQGIFFFFKNVVFYKHFFPYQRVENTSNEIDSPNINDQSLFIKD